MVSVLQMVIALDSGGVVPMTDRRQAACFAAAVSSILSAPVTVAGIGLAVALAAAMPAQAQETSAQISSFVVGADGRPIAGAQVTILHVPSGTSTSATTGSSGQFTATGLRVGGPYRVTARAEGMQDAAVEDLFTLLSQRTSVTLWASSAEPKRCTKQTAPQRAPAGTPGQRRRRLVSIARNAMRRTRPSSTGSRCRKNRSRCGNVTTRWRTGTCGNTCSTKCAAVAAMRRVVQDAHTPRPLQDKFAGSEFGRPKGARRVRAMDGAQQ